MNIDFSSFPSFIQDLLRAIKPEKHVLALALMMPDELQYQVTFSGSDVTFKVSYKEPTQPAPPPTGTQTA